MKKATEPALAPESQDSPALTSSTGSEDLLLRFQSGDSEALDRLWARYLPRLRTWAHGRLPAASRDRSNTDDLIQDAFVRSLSRLRTLQPRGPSSLAAYFRTIVLNQIRDYARQNARRPRRDVLESDVHAHPAPSPLEEFLGLEAIDRYERAKETLTEDDQQIIVAFVELRCTDQELAELFEKSTPNAARMARVRALGRLARAMSLGRTS